MKYYLYTNKEDKTAVVQFTDEQISEIFKNHNYSRLTPGYDTLPELIEGMGLLEEPCRCCGDPVDTHYVEPTKSELKEKNYCFSCNLWDKRVKTAENNPKVLIVNGVFYTDGGNTTKVGSFNGFGGSIFKFVKNDGEVVISNNVWHGGSIPDHFRDKLKDNAILESRNLNATNFS